MHWNTYKQLAGVTAVLLLTGCASSLPPAEPFNHQFDANQNAVGPDFVETEANSAVDGNTPSELLRSLNSANPYRGAGNSLWTISWAYDTEPGAGSCSVNNAMVSVTIDYHLPIWPEQINTPNRILASRWNEYSDALRTHHCKHGKTGIDAALAVKSSLQQLGINGSCDRLEVEADALARSIINTYKAAESQFVPPVISDYIQ